MKNSPFRVTLVLVLVLSLTAWNILRLWTSLTWRAALTEFAGAEILTLTTISGAAWSLAGVFIIWSILQRKNWAGRILILISIAYSIWYWVERLVWQSPRPNWSFAVIVNLMLLLFVMFTIKSLSREAYERETENPTIE
jgi:hypothetical protein